MVEFVKAEWGEVARFIPPAFSDRADLVSDVAAMVKAGVAAAFLGVRDGEAVGALVLDGEGKTLRVLALAGDNGAGMIDAMDAFARHLAKEAGCTRVVAHTTRPGMVLQAARHGWRLDLATVSVEV